MNCKPRDLAMIVTADDATGLAKLVNEAAIGIPVRVTHLRAATSQYVRGLVWNFEEPLRVVVDGWAENIQARGLAPSTAIVSCRRYVVPQYVSKTADAAVPVRKKWIGEQ